MLLAFAAHWPTCAEVSVTAAADLGLTVAAASAVLYHIAAVQDQLRFLLGHTLRQKACTAAAAAAAAEGAI
jgi:hypothetical protein